MGTLGGEDTVASMPSATTRFKISDVARTIVTLCVFVVSAFAAMLVVLWTLGSVGQVVLPAWLYYYVNQFVWVFGGFALSGFVLFMYVLKRRAKQGSAAIVGILMFGTPFLTAIILFFISHSLQSEGD